MAWAKLPQVWCIAIALLLATTNGARHRGATSLHANLPVPRGCQGYASKDPPDPAVCAPNKILSIPTATPTPQMIAISRRQAAAVSDNPYSCDEHKPCSNSACCSRTGVCGYSETYYGETDKSPNNVCWSNCDATTKCGRHSSSGDKTCPLNVCCSQYGFYGITADYCHVTDDKETSCQSNYKQPGSGGSDSNVQKRIIGYYKAWNYKKRCINMPMDDIPVTSLTHIYYSFAYIRPETYEIIPMSDEKDGTLTADTFQKFTALKKKNPAVKAVVALGGWTFNDNHTIWQPVFSDLVSTEAKHNTFIQNLIQFMQRYGFNGVNLDWEYPGAEDRGGHSDNGVNLTKLVREMRVAFSLASIINVVTGSTSAYEISFTAPTSY
ncbi:glycoside hydrolase superfamily [Aspergillus insuetus]